MRFSVLLAAVALPSLALGAPKKQAPVAAATGGLHATVPSPCGVKILPLAVGNTWTYEPVTPPVEPIDQIKRLSPARLKSIVLTVKSIDAKKGADTVITLEEKITTDVSKDEKKPQLDEHTLTTTITCGGKKFEISPDSFLFAGEPGGFYNITIDKLDHPKGTTWQLTNGGIGDAEWREDLAMHWTRVPTPGSNAKLGDGRLELERRFTPQQPENVIGKLGTLHAEKLGLITTGRVFLADAPADKPTMELPAGWITTLWLAEGVGLVQSLNSFGHMYQLTSATLK